MYEPSRNLLECHLAGFAYYDGLDVLERLVPGVRVELEAEPDNPYDPQAVAVRFEGKKLGYLPRAENQLISQLLWFGYGSALEARISSRAMENHPERQFRVAIRLRDQREKVSARVRYGGRGRKDD